jgi:hypothetical protein
MRLGRRRNTTSGGKDLAESADAHRSLFGKSVSDKSVLALLKVDEDGNVPEEEIGRFMREVGLPDNKD